MFSGRRGAILKPSNISNYGSLFGLNVSGAEYSPSFAFGFPRASDWLYLSNIGIKFVRLPIAWESIQTSFGATLDPTFLAALKAALALGHSYGIKSIVDIHNFGCYLTQSSWTSGYNYAGADAVMGAGVNVYGDGTLTTTVFADLWTKLSTALLNNPAVYGYDIMNEPTPWQNSTYPGTNLLSSPNNFTYNATYSIGWWAVSNGSAAVILLPMASNPNPISGYGPVSQFTSGSGYGTVTQSYTFSNIQYTFSIYAKVSSGTLACLLSLGGGTSPVTLTTSWQRFSYTYTPTAGSNTVGITANAGTSGIPIQIANAQLQTGASATGYVASPWHPYAQAAITAIRAVDNITPILYNAYEYGSALYFPWLNADACGLTGGNIIFEGHQYFDGSTYLGNGGNYTDYYSSYSTIANAGVLQITPFVNWLQQTNSKGFIGEFAIPYSTQDNNQAWFPLLQNFLNYLKQQNIPSTMWYYCSNNGQAAAQNWSLNANSSIQLNPNNHINAPQIKYLMNM